MALRARPRTILVAEDESSTRETLRLALEGMGFRTYLAEDGRAALDALAKSLKPDLILMDLIMPLMNGFEVLTVLRAHPDWAAIPLIVMSTWDGYTPEGLHVSAVLRKPFSTDELQERIRALLRPDEPRTM
jgi:CheY-like chemotaxis protein